MSDFYQDFQYDSCISRGICTTNPKIASLQSVLVQYLKLGCKYCLLLEGKNVFDEKIKELILNTIPLAVSNPDLSEASFNFAVSRFKEILPDLVAKYNKIYEKEDFKEGIRSTKLFKISSDIVDSIRYGEQILREAFKNIPDEIRNLFQIMLVISKSISINLLDLESMGESDKSGFNMILKLLPKSLPETM